MLWRRADTPKAVEAALHDVLPALIDMYGSAAGALAAHWYDDLRERREIRGSFTADVADIPDTGAHALIGWAADTAADYATFQTLIAGGAQRRTANFARRTVMGSSVADPHARGWMRVGVGECEFCQMLLGRGAVYTEATADFEAHDHCQCGAEPAF
ncbi:MAG TPA: hypothetical protein VHB18_11790 [Mycobacteriales bacterium]|nr:hypothetical protein [Mycobacteriales bacterium]